MRECRFNEAGLQPATLPKTLCHRCFPVNFGKFSRTPFLQNTSGRLLSMPRDMKLLDYSCRIKFSNFTKKVCFQTKCRKERSTLISKFEILAPTINSFDA